MNTEIRNSDLIKRSNGMPADLTATVSKLSPSLPKVIMEEMSISKRKGQRYSGSAHVTC